MAGAPADCGRATGPGGIYTTTTTTTAAQKKQTGEQAGKKTTTNGIVRGQTTTTPTTQTELRTRLEQFGEELDEEGLHNPDDIGFDNVSDPEAPDELKEKEVEVLKMDVLLKRWRLYLKELSKENIADVKLRPTADDCVVKVMRCFFYALGKLPMSKVNGDKLDATPSRLASWRLVRANIKPHPFLTSLQSYDVATAPKRSILRVRRILTSLQGSDDVIKEKGGQAVYLLFQWLWTTVEYRCARDELFKAKKEAGKDMPGMEGWEDDAGEPLEGEEQDEDEELQRKLDEAAAAEAAQDGAEEAEAAED